jgi:hypothetical protein
MELSYRFPGRLQRKESVLITAAVYQSLHPRL